MTIQAKQLKVGDITLTTHGPTVQENTVESIREDGGERVVTYTYGTIQRFSNNEFVEIF